MPKTNIQTIDPVTRIEGHLSVKIEVKNSKVTDSWSSGLLFRGFENILQGRDPADAPVLTQRICGVCHAVHRLTSIFALENANGTIPPPDAVRIRNIEQGINFVYSHAAHIFMLSGPDYDLYGLVPGLSQGLNMEKYNSIIKDVILPAQRLCHEVGAIFGGKTPHHMTTVPGGVTCVPTSAAVEAALEKVQVIKDAMAIYLPLVHDYLDAHKPEMEQTGIGYGNFLAYGVFSDPYDPQNPDKLLLKRGVFLNGGYQTLDINRINEEVQHSWYTNNSGGRPSDETPPEPYYGKAGAYSWLKSPRYGGEVMEVGPLARMAISQKYPPRASLYDRLKARIHETQFVLENVEKWILELTPGSKVFEPNGIPLSSQGIGLWEAPRGANGHWVKIESGKIAHYQVVSPTNWNASPRDNKGLRGAIEQALIGAAAEDPERAPLPLKIVRSFDPCLACSIH